MSDYSDMMDDYMEDYVYGDKIQEDESVYNYNMRLNSSAIDGIELKLKSNKDKFFKLAAKFVTPPSYQEKFGKYVNVYFYDTESVGVDVPDFPRDKYWVCVVKSKYITYLTKWEDYQDTFPAFVEIYESLEKFQQEDMQDEEQHFWDMITDNETENEETIKRANSWIKDKE